MPRKNKYNLEALEVGNTSEHEGTMSKVSAACCMYGKRYGKKFSCKKINDKVVITRVS